MLQANTPIFTPFGETDFAGIGTTNPGYKLDMLGAELRVHETVFTGGQWTTSGSDIYYNLVMLVWAKLLLQVVIYWI
jgi:hypothetical protein